MNNKSNLVDVTSIFQTLCSRNEVSKLIDNLNKSQISINHMCMLQSDNEQSVNFSFVVNRDNINIIQRDFFSPWKLREGKIQRKPPEEHLYPTINNVHKLINSSSIQSLFFEPHDYIDLILILDPKENYYSEIWNRLNSLNSKIGEGWYTSHIQKWAGINKSIHRSELSDTLKNLCDVNSDLMPGAIWIVDSYKEQYQKLLISVWENDVKHIQSAYGSNTSKHISIRASGFGRLESLWITLENTLGEQLAAISNNVVSCPTDGWQATILFERAK